MLTEKLKNKHIILASQSPRRQELLKSLDINFEIEARPVDEVFPDHLKKEQVVIYLAELKAASFQKGIEENTIVITSDTIVCYQNEILGKPKDADDAFQMISKLSGGKHSVITGVNLLSKNKSKAFFSETIAHFDDLSNEEINYYIEEYKPYDKAGAYGIQEWIGKIGINKIEGCYFNVMGLPLHRLYQELSVF